jgi:branched-chain amino acid transport system ATP-binding protein
MNPASTLVTPFDAPTADGSVAELERPAAGQAASALSSEPIANAGRRIGEVILDVRNISLAFGGVRALTDISFDVCEHEVRAIIGPNGAGKSSLLNCINGVYQPQQGSITFRGKTFAT